MGPVSRSTDLNGTARYIWPGQSGWWCLEELDGSDHVQTCTSCAPGSIDVLISRGPAPHEEEESVDSNELMLGGFSACM